MPKKVIILGGQGYGFIIASIIERDGLADIIGFLNDVEPLGTELGINKKYRVLGRTEEIHDFLNNDEDLHVMCGWGGMKYPEADLIKLRSLDIAPDRFFSVIDKMSLIPLDFCKIGVGFLAGPFSSIGPNTTIGDHTAVFAQSYIGHDSVVGEFCHISHAFVGSYTQIGRGVHVGRGANISDNIKIGDFALIGLSTVVVKDVPENAVVFGNPAKIIRYRKEPKGK